MKFLLIIAIVFLIAWLWRNNRRASSDDAAAAPKQPKSGVEQQDMIRCPVCSVHFPRSDALPGPDGRLYCCAEHRSRGEA